ncbi:hypothetical protein VARIO8X_20015 [Burkholderiales bacterium 8X]|nr:hypothetical protein VARIO8X_20015 [Burkholderiales bacterium 8X]
MRAQLAAKLLGFGAGVAAPIVFINEHEHFEHAINIAERPCRRPSASCGSLKESAGQARELSVQFEFEQPRLQFGSAESGSCAQGVEADRVVADGAEQAGCVAVGVCDLRWAQAFFARPVRGCRRAGCRGEFFMDVARQLDQLGALPDQRMAAARLRRVDRPGDGEDLAAEFGRKSGGDKRPRLQGRLDHQRAPREPGNDPVALREVLVEGWRAEGELAHDQAAIGNAVGHRAVLGRVDAVEAGADHGHRGGEVRPGCRFQGAFMRRAVDARGQPRHHAPAGIAEILGERPGVDQALGCRIAAADDGDAAGQRRQIETGRADDIQQDRRIGRFEKCGRITRIAERQDPADRAGIIRRAKPFERSRDDRLEVRRHSMQSVGLRQAHHLGQHRGGLVEDGLRQAEARQQLAGGNVAHAGRQGEPEPPREFGSFHAVLRGSGIGQQVADARRVVDLEHQGVGHAFERPEHHQEADAFVRQLHGFLRAVGFVDDGLAVLQDGQHMAVFDAVERALVDGDHLVLRGELHGVAVHRHDARLDVLRRGARHVAHELARRLGQESVAGPHFFAGAHDVDGGRHDVHDLLALDQLAGGGFAALQGGLADVLGLVAEDFAGARVLEGRRVPEQAEGLDGAGSLDQRRVDVAAGVGAVAAGEQHAPVVGGDDPRRGREGEFVDHDRLAQERFDQGRVERRQGHAGKALGANARRQLDDTVRPIGAAAAAGAQAGAAAGLVEEQHLAGIDAVRVLDLGEVHAPEFRPAPGAAEEDSGDGPERVAGLDGVFVGCGGCEFRQGNAGLRGLLRGGALLGRDGIVLRRCREAAEEGSCHRRGNERGAKAGAKQSGQDGQNFCHGRWCVHTAPARPDGPSQFATNFALKPRGGQRLNRCLLQRWPEMVKIETIFPRFHVKTNHPQLSGCAFAQGRQAGPRRRRAHQEPRGGPARNHVRRQRHRACRDPGRRA